MGGGWDSPAGGGGMRDRKRQSRARGLASHTWDMQICDYAFLEMEGSNQILNVSESTEGHFHGEFVCFNLSSKLINLAALSPEVSYQDLHVSTSLKGFYHSTSSLLPIKFPSFH